MSFYRLLTFLFSILFFSFICNAQEAYKIGDVTRLRCDIQEIGEIDALTSEVLQKDVKGVFIVYGKEGSATRYSRYVKDRLVKFHNMNPQSFSAYYGGYSETPRMEVWAVPKNAKEPQVNTISESYDSTYFDKYFYPFTTQYCPDERLPALKLYAEKLRKNQISRGYIIFYSGRKKAELPLSLRQGHRQALNDKKLLIKFGVESSRINIISGGHSEESYAELWVVSPNSKPPKPTIGN